MKNKVPRSRLANLVSGALAFLLTSAVTVTIAVLLFDRVKEQTGGNSAMLALTMAGCIVVIAAVFTAIDVIRRKIMIDRPVEQILNGTQKIIEGDFSARFLPRHRYGKYDEYDVIMDNLNQVASELSKTEILRNDFVSNVSHEIKTPLAVVQNYTAALQSKTLSQAEREQYLETIRTAVSRLSGLVANILKLNKLENQTIQTDKTTVNLSASIADVVLSFEDSIDEKEIDLQCELDEELSMVADRSFLEIIWGNLLSNALKFTPRGGKIAVTLKRAGGFAVVSVSDTGEGMTRETGERIFDKFYQGDTSHAGQGNGLGLALVKKVIDLIGGEITVESAPGEGSTFTVQLQAEA